jgi:hypothetical protein
MIALLLVVLSLLLMVLLLLIALFLLVPSRWIPLLLQQIVAHCAEQALA